MREFRLLFKEDGSITILCALLMSVLVLFFTVLLDLSRILVLHNTSENQLRLAMTSVLSAYDKQLYERYGLFGRGGTNSLTLLKEILAGNQNSAYELESEHKPFNLVSKQFSNIEIMEEAFLGQHDVFERQLITEMKYKAPIDFVLELLEEWLSLSNAVDSSQQLTKVLDEIEDLFHEREQLLEKALKAQKELGKYMQSSKYYQLITNQLLSVIEGYPSYTDYVRFEANLEEEEESKYEMQIISYLSRVQRTVNEIETMESSTLDGVLQKEEQINGFIRQAAALNNTIKIKYEQHQLKKTTSQSMQEDVLQLPQEWDELDIGSEDIVRDPAWFTAYISAIDEQVNLFMGITTEAGSVAATVYSEANYPPLEQSVSRGIYHEMISSHQNLKATLQSYIRNYDNPARLIQVWESDMTNSREVKAKLEEGEKQFKELLKEYDSISSLFTMKDHSEKARGDYKQVEQNYKLNVKINAAIEDEKEQTKEEQKTGRKKALATLTDLKALLHKLEDSMVSLRDHVYINEYSLHHFTYFPMGDISDELQHQSIGAELSQFSKQQVEYIIYGKYEPMQNVLLSSSEIFAIRFAIRTIEGFIANRYLTNPLLILSAAVIHGMRLAISDMVDLVNKGFTTLSRYIPVEVSYKNYLRLILLLHSGSKEHRLSRMIATIEHERGYSLMAVPTGVSGRATSSVQLWSPPGVSHLLNALASKDQLMRGNVYEATQIIGVSY